MTEENVLKLVDLIESYECSKVSFPDWFVHLIMGEPADTHSLNTEFQPKGWGVYDTDSTSGNRSYVFKHMAKWKGPGFRHPVPNRSCFVSMSQLFEKGWLEMDFENRCVRLAK